MVFDSRRKVVLVCLVYFIDSLKINKILLTFGTKESEEALLGVVERSEQKNSGGSFEVPWVEIRHDSTSNDITTLEEEYEYYPLKFNTLLTYFNRTLNVSMKLNTLMMSVKPTLVSYGEDGELIEEGDPDDCAYYQGYEASYPNIPSTMSLCTDGLQGVLMLNGSTLLLEPSRQYLPLRQRGQRLIFGPHRLRKSDTNMLYNQTLDFVKTNITTERSAGRSRRQSPDHLTGTKYVEMYVVNDRSEYTWLGSNKNNNMKRMKQVANIMDSLYTPHNIRAILMGVEVWNDNDKMVVSKTGSTTLNNFLRYRRDKILPRFAHDCSLFVTRVDFTGPTIGLAPVNGMCSPVLSGNVNQDTSTDHSQLAGTMTHEMGHNFGMKHDKTACYCDDRTRRCIMSPYAQTPIATTFSRCSKNELNTYLKGDMARCLIIPNLRNGLHSNDTRCGNNKLDPGEECDCGLPKWCKNRCCNPNTCKFISAGYQCARGGCCRNCRVQVNGTVCRKAHDSCDLDEQCDGMSPECPEDLYMRDGIECKAASQDGYCNKGRCRSHNAQCQYGWGVGAKQADLGCYLFNTRGVDYGNCGVNGGVLVKCAVDDILCGLLHCIDRPESSKYPIIGFGRRRMSFYFIRNGKQVKCDTGGASLGKGEPNPCK